SSISTSASSSASPFFLARAGVALDFAGALALAAVLRAGFAGLDGVASASSVSAAAVERLVVDADFAAAGLAAELVRAAVVLRGGRGARGRGAARRRGGGALRRGRDVDLDAGARERAEDRLQPLGVVDGGLLARGAEALGVDATVRAAAPQQLLQGGVLELSRECGNRG